MLKCLFVLFIMLSTQNLFASQIQFKAEDGKTEFFATGKPAMIKINGQGSGPSGTLTSDKDKISGTLKVDLNSLKTGIELRDDHTKNKYLEVAKFPNAEITFVEFAPATKLSAFTDKEVEVPFTGKLTIKGKTGDINGVAKLKKTGQKLSGSAEFSVKIMTYLESLPNYSGIKVAEDVLIKIQLSGTIQ